MNDSQISVFAPVRIGGLWFVMIKPPNVRRRYVLLVQPIAFELFESIADPFFDNPT